MTGGWQTSKEPAYVEASRARQGTDWYVSRQDLGVEGHDTDRIQRLAQSMSRSHAQTPSLAHPELPDPDYGPGLHPPIAPSRTSPIPGIVRGDQPDHQPTSTGANTMSQRRQIVLPDPVDQQLHELAAAADTPPSTLAAQMVQAGVAQAAKDGKVRPLRPTPCSSAREAASARPGLSPTAATASGAGRCGARSSRCTAATPNSSHAQGQMVDSDATTETLCALAAWRAELDDAGQDPREELAFQTQLADYSQVLRQQGGGVTKAWKPGATPPEWAGE